MTGRVYGQMGKKEAMCATNEEGFCMFFTLTLNE